MPPKVTINQIERLIDYPNMVSREGNECDYCRCVIYYNLDFVLNGYIFCCNDCLCLVNEVHNWSLDGF